ncbi:uncharacterized protein LY89DRAFT_63501 [Mollisia scopiformis]|uniref:Uncharacterized protein n=1 Tax=Mollisia scopiformis TaxID=149040 RepID=A0A194X994_MOLSC|nr:uncharacterized protein LY89DRAFT_63501 [Mollisia scopiformis]KUJ16740.1 hypothetical protein LY89DRAFT_63501 [Mollisia scopiformis]
MVTIKAIRDANKSISSNFTVIFVGATSGIGLGAVETLLKSTTASKIYIIGRSQSSFAPTLAKLKNLNASAEIIFIEAQVSLLKDVERVCTIINTQESTIDLLWLSQGGLPGGHILTPEGLFEFLAIGYYSRLLFMSRLVPLLNKASNPRVVSVLTASQEGAINTADMGVLDPKNYNLFPTMRQGVMMMSLSMKELSMQNPKISFVHTNPGMVSTNVHHNWANSMTGYFTVFRWLLEWVLIPLMHIVGSTSEEAGEIGLYELTTERYGVGTGNNFFRLDEKAEDAGANSLLEKYEEDGTQKKVWEHTLEVFDKVLAQ